MLTKDPLRYVRNRAQLQSDTAIDRKNESEAANQTSTSAPNSRSERKNKKGTGFDLRLLRNRQGEEQSFEEARANAKYFTIFPSSENFNLLHTLIDDQSSQMDLDESSEDMSIGGFPEELTTNISAPYHSVDTRDDSIVSRRSVFQQGSSFDGSLNRTAVSTASSTVDEIAAVGVPTKREEETINTKFAMRELSMMFSSPAVGADDMARKTERAFLNRSTSANDSSDHVMNIMDHQRMNNSIFNIEEDDNNENDGECNTEGRDTSTPGFHGMALREIDGDQDGGHSLSCQAQQRRGIPSQLSQKNPLSRSEVELHSDAGFLIFEDDRVDENQAIVPKAKSSFAIFEDEGESKSNQPPAIFEGKSTNPPRPKNKSSFATFQDVQEGTPDQSFSKDPRKRTSSKPSGFSIFENEKGVSPLNDVKQSPQSSCAESDNGETATLSLFEGAIEMLGGNDDSNSQGSSANSVHEGQKRQSNGDTASISLFNEAFAEFEIEKTHSPRKPSTAVTRKHKFGIFVDESTQDAKVS